MKRWLRAAVSVAILAATLWLLDWRSIAAALQDLSVTAIVAALAVTLLHFLVLAWRWYLLVQPLAPRAPLEHFKHYFIATYVNSFTPANIGGDVYRVAALGGNAPLIVAVLRERLIGLLAYLASLAALAFLLPSAPPLIQAAAIAAAVGACVLLAAPRLPLIKSLMPSWRPLPGWLALSLIALALWIAAVKIVALDLGIAVPWALLGVIVIATELLRMVPVTIQGIGVREATFAWLLAQLGGSAEAGFVLGAVSYVVLTCALACCGVIGWVLSSSHWLE